MIKYNDLDVKKYPNCFWGQEGQDVYTDQEIDDAIQYHLDGMHPDKPETIEIVGMVPQEMARESASHLIRESLSDAWENFSENYGHSDIDDFEPMENLEICKAVENLIDAVRSNYRVALLTEVVRVEVDVRPWVEENCPHWIEDGDFGGVSDDTK